MRDGWIFCRGLGRGGLLVALVAGILSAGAEENFTTIRENEGVGSPEVVMITAQPISRVALVGGVVKFTVGATGSSPFVCEWRKNGTNLAGTGNISGLGTTNLTISRVEFGDAGSYGAVLTDSHGSVTSGVAVLTVVTDPLAAGLNSPNVAWSSGGSAPWFAQGSRFHDGVSAAQSGRVTHKQESWLQGAVDGPGTMSFWWAVSSEAGYDLLEFYLDGVLQPGTLTGTIGWRSRMVGISPGPHTARWRYVKDGVGSAGSDAGWVDEVVFTPESPAPRVTTPPLNRILVTGSRLSLAVATTGRQPLTCQWRFCGTNLANGGTIEGVTSTNLSISGLQTHHAGEYSLVVSNSYGSVTGRVATLSVVVNPGGTWAMTGSMGTGRNKHTATLLQNGKVLVAGGNSKGGLASSAELYDPESGTWSKTASMLLPRRDHRATLLRNGKVLVAGGCPGDHWTSSAELYDPASGSWSATGEMSAGRGFHTATLLHSGKVLVAGGAGSRNLMLSSAELYDPATGAWTVTGSMAKLRYIHSATLLPDGRVLVAGGWNGTNFPAGAEIYDPASATWTTTGWMNTARSGHIATLLANGTVLVAGGAGGVDVEFRFVEISEIYDPSTGLWRTTGPLSDIGFVFEATLFPNGKVLATGTDGPCSFNAQLFDPATGVWSPTDSIKTYRDTHTATLLCDGRVLVAGGSSDNYPITTELYTYPAGAVRPRVEVGGSNGVVDAGWIGQGGSNIGLRIPTNHDQWQPASTNSASPQGKNTGSPSTNNQRSGL